MFDSGNPLGANGCTSTAGRRMDVDQNLCRANTVERSQDFFGIVLNCRGNIGIVGGERELHFYFATVDLDTLDETERDYIAAKTGITN